MIFGTSCLKFCQELNVGEWTICSKTKKEHFEFSLEEFEIIKNEQVIFNGLKGGLVLGNLHSEGGIHLIIQISKNRFRYIAEMEGWEYLTSPLKDNKFAEKFKALNELTKNIGQNIKTDFNIPENCKLIDTTGIVTPFILITPHQHYILNRFATKEHIEEIIELDKKNYS